MMCPTPVVLESGNLLLSSLEPLIAELECQIRTTRGSQQALNEKMEIMSQFLHEINESSEPYDIQIYTGRLEDSKRRINNVNQTLTTLTERLSRLQRQLAREAYKRKQLIQEEEKIPAPPPQ